MPGDRGQLPLAGSVRGGRAFFLSGYYGQGNLGDDLLLQAVIEGICRISPVRRFIVRNEGDIAGLKNLSVPIELTGLDRIAADQTKSKFRRLLLTLMAYRTYLNRCDWFIFGGGTVFHERTSVLPIAMTFLICILARITGVRIAALGVGVAPIRSVSGRFLLRRIVGLSDIFAVRDKEGLAECERARTGSKAVLTADLVFTMTKNLLGPEANSPPEVPTVGISVYPPALRNPETGDHVSAVVSDAMEVILARGWRIVLLAFHCGSDRTGADFDPDALRQLAEHLPAEYRERIMLAEPSAADANGIRKIFSELTVHCGMRFHGHVLSAIFHKPFAGVAVDNKIDAICHSFEMPLVQLAQISVTKVVEAIDQAMERHIAPEQLAKCELAAAENFSRLAQRFSAA